MQDFISSISLLITEISLYSYSMSSTVVGIYLNVYITCTWESGHATRHYRYCLFDIWAQEKSWYTVISMQLHSTMYIKYNWIKIWTENSCTLLEQSCLRESVISQSLPPPHSYNSIFAHFIYRWSKMSNPMSTPIPLKKLSYSKSKLSSPINKN